ncbi:MAG: Nramp family divalent metal transporter [Mariniblastus sp.]|nr:Nramp family divalent metal transporter [Mariniblastus sp.]
MGTEQNQKKLNTLQADPYSLDSSKIREPPVGLRASLKYLGPGFILSASIVGSGELIATTIMGAKAGFVLLWFIIFSCIVKVVVQLEFGKHAICSGETTMQALNSMPGPRLGKANWSIWLWLILMLTKTCQLGGIIGGVVLGLEQLIPSLGTAVLFENETIKLPLRYLTTLLVGVSVSVLVFRGYYVVLEKASLIMIGLFTLLTMFSLVMLQSTEMAVTGMELGSGLTPSWPEGTLLLVAIGAFGITGVGGDEVLAYNYWLIEKGYAAYTGPKDDSVEWERRAKGWIRVMYWDAILAMVCYTLMTSMFYLLGAAILHRNGVVPESNQLIATLGTMYTETLGPWSKIGFVLGAVVVLYSTMFAALAAWTRLYSDALGQIGVFDFKNIKSRKIAIGVFAWVFPVAWTFLFLFFEKPGVLVIIGGVITVVILLIVVFAALFFRYRRLDRRLKPTTIYDLTLWISALAILAVAGFAGKDAIVNAIALARDSGWI